MVISIYYINHEIFDRFYHNQVLNPTKGKIRVKRRLLSLIPSTPRITSQSRGLQSFLSPKTSPRASLQVGFKVLWSDFGFYLVGSPKGKDSRYKNGVFSLSFLSWNLTKGRRSEGKVGQFFKIKTNTNLGQSLLRWPTNVTLRCKAYLPVFSLSLMANLIIFL